MTWRDILIQVGSDPREAERLALAADLAERLGARLRGAHLRGPRLIDVAGASPDPSWMVSTEVQRVAQEQEAEETQGAEQARETFQSVVGRDLTSNWIDLEWSLEAWIAQARCADLTIVGATGDTRLYSPMSPDRLAAVSGGPVLILPPTADGPIGHRVLCAWNGGREASRALKDAMPLLELAEAVTVLSVETAEAAPVDDAGLGAHLQAHGVAATLVQRRGSNPAAILRREALSRAADLIVMGVYGRSRMAEWVLGGVSRAMLCDPPLPLLISH
ncbi:MAG TPA: universal stress protein [Caulobacteraceae bacterium]